MKDWRKRLISRICGLFLIFTLVSCGSGSASLDTPKAASTPTSLPPVPSRISAASLPKICNCVLRFDRISIEQGLSQSSAQAIYQDSRGFLWIGTEDGLNRYDGYAFKIYKPEPDDPDSLSDRWVTSIAEDKDGYLWFATRLGGINRYDPGTEKFTQFLHDDADPNSLSDNYVNVLYIDNNNNLWAGTHSALDLFDPTNNQFKHYVPASDKSDVRNEINVTTILQDSHERYWVGIANGGLNKFDPQTNTFFAYTNSPDNQNTISHMYVTAIEEASDSTLWVGTKSGLNRFDPETETFRRFTHSDENTESIIGNTVSSLLLDSTGNLWIGTTRGLDRLSEDGDVFIHHQNDPAFNRSISENQIISIYEDRGGIIWFGTRGGGLNKYDRQRDNFEYYRHSAADPNSLSGNFIFPIYIDFDGGAWIGTNGEGLNRFNWRANQVIQYRNNPKDPNSLGSDDVTAIAEDQDGIFWIGTSAGLDRLDRFVPVFTHFKHDPMESTSLSANFIYSVFVDSQNEVWIGTANGLDRLDRKTNTFIHYPTEPGSSKGLSGNAVGTIYEDRNGILWFGTVENGLNRFDRRTGIFTQYRYDAKNKKSLSNDSIFSIYQDSQGRIWIGTGGGGLVLFHPETNSFTYYLEKDGLPNGVVYSILEDKEGNLWMSTNFGISRFNPETGAFRNYDAGDGLQSNEFNSNAYAKGKDGELYFGGINGLTVFQPEKITDNSYIPQVTLTSLTQDDQPVAINSSVETVKNVTLRWPQNSFEFEFAALTYNQPNKNQYAYMLEDFDTNWHYIGTKRDGRYTNLPGGDYTLLLKASNSDGIWRNVPVRINVTVIPPFWQTVWFQIVLGLLAIATVTGGIRLRTKSIQDRNRELERLVRERTSALEKRNEEVQALYEADERILRNVSLNQVFQTLVDVAVDMLHADRSVVFAWDDGQTKVLPRVSHGFSPETLKVLHFAKGEGIIGEVLATGKPAIFRHIEPNSFRPEVRAAILEEGIRSFVHLPIIVDHKVAGVFNVGFTTPNLIGDDTMRLFSALTHRASISIANMELFEQTKDLAVMEERNRLARDLHDSAKQKAFAALAQLGTARGILNGNGNSATLHLNEAENLVSDVIQELTFLVQEIYPIALQEKGLPTTLREYIYEWENRNDTKVQLVTRNEHRLSLDVEQAIYRVIQESLANVARHSSASRVDVSLVYNDDSLQLSVSDNGSGFNMDQKSQGMGLRSIRERVSSIHGTAQVQSAPGQGTRVIVQVPIKG